MNELNFGHFVAHAFIKLQSVEEAATRELDGEDSGMSLQCQLNLTPPATPPLRACYYPSL
jgi:hypothetical protein